MKKVYAAPLIECLTFIADETIAAADDSFPYNDGELGWT